MIRHEQELRCDKASLSSFNLGLDCTRFTQTGCVISKSLLEKWANDSSLEYLLKDHAVLLGTVDPAHLQQDVTWLHSIHDAVSLACCAGLEVDLCILGIILLGIPKLCITRAPHIQLQMAHMATTRVTKEGGDHLLGTLCSMAGGAKSFGRWGAGQTAAGGTRGLGSAFQLTFLASPVSHGMMEGWNIYLFI